MASPGRTAWYWAREGAGDRRGMGWGVPKGGGQVARGGGRWGGGGGSALRTQGPICTV